MEVLRPFCQLWVPRTVSFPPALLQTAASRELTAAFGMPGTRSGRQLASPVVATVVGAKRPRDAPSPRARPVVQLLEGDDDRPRNAATWLGLRQQGCQGHTCELTQGCAEASSYSRAWITVDGKMHYSQHQTSEVAITTSVAHLFGSKKQLVVCCSLEVGEEQICDPFLFEVARDNVLVRERPDDRFVLLLRDTEASLRHQAARQHLSEIGRQEYDRQVTHKFHARTFNGGDAETRCKRVAAAIIATILVAKELPVAESSAQVSTSWPCLGWGYKGKGVEERDPRATMPRNDEFGNACEQRACSFA